MHWVCGCRLLRRNGGNEHTAERLSFVIPAKAVDSVHLGSSVPSSCAVPLGGEAAQATAPVPALPLGVMHFRIEFALQRGQFL